MSDNNQLLRQWSLLLALSRRRRGATLREMAAEHGVTQRTIRRDLAKLQQIGFPLTETESDHGRRHWSLGDGRETPSMSFTWEEAVSLYLGRRLLEPLAGTQFWNGAQKAFRKIRATLGETALHHLEKMADAFHHTTIGAGDYTRKGEMIDRLLVGIEDRCITLVTYQSMRATEPVTYEIYPYGIVYHRGSLYLVAHSTDHDEVRHFKVDRLDDVEVQQLKFRKPADFDLESHLAESFGIFRGDGRPVDIRIRFAAEVARYVEESRWHPTQKLTRENDGSLILTVRLGDTDEIKKWVLSFGANAVVLEPEELAEEIRGEAVRIADRYRPRTRRTAK